MELVAYGKLEHVVLTYHIYRRATCIALYNIRYTDVVASVHCQTEWEVIRCTYRNSQRY